MAKLLVINSSPLTDNSVTRGLVTHFVERWRQRHPDTEVLNRDLGRNPPAPLDEVTIGAFFTPAEARNPAQCRAVALSDTLVDELQSADALVIAAPMHNFTITGALKAYIDQVARVGRTFQYTENGPVGLLADRPVYVITSSGGVYGEGSPAAAMNHRDALLQTVLNFMGLKDLHFIHVEGAASGTEGAEKARTVIDALG